MIKLNWLVPLSAALGCLSPCAFAFDIPLYAAGEVSLGYSPTSVPTGFSRPTLVNLGVGASGGYQVTDMWIAGLSTGFSFINQYSSIDTSGANYKGTRWNIVSPMVGAQVGKLTALVDFEFLGNYNLARPSSAGGNVAFKKPVGFRISGTWDAFEHIAVGGLFEYLAFGQRGDSTAGDVDLANKQKLWQLGALASYKF